jgi:periplasmic protein TonB
MLKIILISAIAASVAVPVAMCPAGAKSYSIGTETAAAYEHAEVISNPQPTVPPALHEECFKSCCIARFHIDAEGKTKVRLLSSTGSEEIDDITLSTLKRWKFRPATLDGKPVPSTRRIKVEFQID